jgi:hypothetical protein
MSDIEYHNCHPRLETLPASRGRWAVVRAPFADRPPRQQAPASCAGISSAAVIRSLINRSKVEVLKQLPEKIDDYRNMHSLISLLLLLMCSGGYSNLNAIPADFPEGAYQRGRV